MTNFELVCLAVMAASLLIMAIIQIGLIIVGIRVAKQVAVTAEEVRRELRPLVEKVNHIADDVTRMSTLATLQVERVDRLLATTAERVDGTLGVLQAVVGGPVSRGLAAISAFRAALSVFRQWQGRKKSTREDDDALFVG